MTKVSISKPDAARRQLDLAIRLIFEGEDQVPIHTLIAAGFALVRDLLKKQKGVDTIVDVMNDWIKPEHAKEVWRVFNGPANFLKHANSDPHDVLNVSWEINEPWLAMAVKGYTELGFGPTDEMRAFLLWYTFRRPDYLKEEFVWPAGVLPTVLDLRVRAAEPGFVTKLGPVLLKSPTRNSMFDNSTLRAAL